MKKIGVPGISNTLTTIVSTYLILVSTWFHSSDQFLPWESWSRSPHHWNTSTRISVSSRILMVNKTLINYPTAKRSVYWLLSRKERIKIWDGWGKGWRGKDAGISEPIKTITSEWFQSYLSMKQNNPIYMIHHVFPPHRYAYLPNEPV